MLVLQRRNSESIFIEMPDGREIKITVCRGGIDRSWLGIDAPLDCRILREEVKAAIDKQAAKSLT